LSTPGPSHAVGIRQSVEISSNCRPIVVYSSVQAAAIHESIYQRRLFQDCLDVGNAFKLTTKLAPELMKGSFKSRFERVDVVFRLRLVNAGLDQSRIEAGAELTGTSFKSLKDDTDFTVIGSVELRLLLSVYSDY